MPAYERYFKMKLSETCLRLWSSYTIRLTNPMTLVMRVSSRELSVPSRKPAFEPLSKATSLNQAAC